MTDPHGISTDEIRASFAAGFDLERELLGGGMSRVFLATDRALNRKVVIKVLPPELAAGVNRERFRREVQLAAQLQHPHIVPLYSAGAQGDVLYYTMPFIEGESLKNALQEKKRFSPREVLRVLHDVVDALGYAHARGVIHRDIKPGNVLRSGNHAVVTDFGVAKAISVSMPAAPGMTTSGMVVGSPAYMAPEQLAGDPNADHRMDIYAVGLLAYELLTGDGPFQSSSPQETMAAQLTRTPAPLDKVRKDVPPGLSNIIMKCLEKRPEARWQNAGELLAELDALSLPSGEFAASGATKRPWLVLAAAGIGLAAIAVWQNGRNASNTVSVVRDTVTMSPGGTLLTRSESLAIAKAVEARIAEQRAERRRADSTSKAATNSNVGTTKAPAAALGADALKRMADSIRDDIQRSVFDSIARMQQASAFSNDGRRGGGRGPGLQVFGGRDGGPQGAPRGGRGDTRVYVEGLNGPGARSITGIAPELDSMMRVMELATRGMRVGALDPLNFAKRATSMGPPRRVVITEPRVSRGMEEAGPVGAGLADTLRRALGSKRFIIVPQDSVRAALEKTRTIDDLASILNADMFASISVQRFRGDSSLWQVTSRDMTAHGAYSVRAFPSMPSPPRGPVMAMDSLVARTVASFNEMDKAPRKPPPDDAPGGPLAKEAVEARAANMGPPRRLIVWTHPPDRARPEIEAAGTIVAEHLRKQFASNPRYVVVPIEETLNALLKTRDREQVSLTTRAELMVTIRGNMTRADSVTWTTTAWDLGAFPVYEQRQANAGRVPISTPAANVDSLFKSTSRALETLDRAPRKPKG
jgi:serine/threonine protein kinase